MYAALPTNTSESKPASATVAPAAQLAVTPTPAVIVAPTMENVPTLAGYQNAGIRILEQPAAVVRNGITVAVEQVIVYPERIELVYTMRGLPIDSLFDPRIHDVTFSCGGPDSYPSLVLPDGTLINPENYILDGKGVILNTPFAYSYLIHLYKTTIPADVNELTFTLHCLELAHLERAPLDWVIPFRIRTQ
jgi:hypothetical protein